MNRKQFLVVFSLLTVVAAAVLAWSTWMALRPSPGHAPDIAGCRAAMRQQLVESMRTGAEGTRPPVCSGLSDEQLAQIAEELMTEMMTGE